MLYSVYISPHFLHNKEKNLYYIQAFFFYGISFYSVVESPIKPGMMKVSKVYPKFSVIQTLYHINSVFYTFSKLNDFSLSKYLRVSL